MDKELKTSASISTFTRWMVVAIISCGAYVVYLTYQVLPLTYKLPHVPLEDLYMEYVEESFELFLSFHFRWG